MRHMTHPSHTGPRLWFLSLLVLAALACQFGAASFEATPTPVPQAGQVGQAETAVPASTALPATPTAVPPSLPASDTTGEATAVTVEQMQAATVQILAKARSGDRLRTMWTGSGTIVTPDGLIVTNAHVARPTSPGLAALYNDVELLFSEEPDLLVVALVESADRAPVETYVAEVLAADGLLDLAVLRVTGLLDGTPVDNQTLELPYLNLGDSDSVKLGDQIQVLGFPGAGGETITYTRGDVSGFESQDRVGDRAWIKTDTTVSPGNSGGLGANTVGQLVGVPSFVLEAQGGAINRLRSINLARPLLEAARSGTPYVSPYVVEGGGLETFQFLTWAEDYSDEDGCGLGMRQSFAAGSRAVVAVFSFKGMTDGESVVEVWYRDGEVLLSNVRAWDAGSRGQCVPFIVHNFGDPLPSGRYRVEVYAGPDLDLLGSAETTVGVAGGSQPATGQGVQVSGQVTDADTGLPIAGAVVFLLKPGVDVNQWLDDARDEAIFTAAEADEQGEYRLPDLLPRGQSYPGVAAARGYRTLVGFLEITAEDPATLVVDLQLSR